MAIANVAYSAVAYGSNGGTTAAINTIGADLIVIGVGVYQGTYVVSDNMGNSYTPLTAYGPNINGIVQLFYCLSPTVGASHTFTLAATGGAISGIILGAAYSGVGSYQTVSGTANGLQPGSITSTQNGALLFTAIVDRGFPVFNSIDSGFNLIATQQGISSTCQPGAWADLIQTTTAAVNPTWGYTGTDYDPACTMACFLPGGGPQRTLVGIGV